MHCSVGLQTWTIAMYINVVIAIQTTIVGGKVAIFSHTKLCFCVYDSLSVYDSFKLYSYVAKESVEKQTWHYVITTIIIVLYMQFKILLATL